MTHREVIELLPWYANATLSEGERREVDAHLSSCAACAEELNQFKAIGLAVVESAEAVPEPSKALLHRAMAEIDSFERGKQRAAMQSGSWLSDLLDRVGDALFGWLSPMPALARAVVAAQFLVIVGLAGGLGYALWRDQSAATLSGTAQVGEDRSRIKVGFEESVTEAQLRKILSEVGGKIVDGPSAQGLYTIEVPVPPANADQLDRLVQSLRARRQIVTYAEREG
jgi:anti-sigma factor RsiW